MQSATYIIGIDEVGRGPIAGPVTVAAVAIRSDHKLAVLSLAEDSKTLSPDMRQYIYKEACKVRGRGMWFSVASVPARTIDTVGINTAIQKAIARNLARLESEGIRADNSFVFLDGSLTAPAAYKQKTVIGGDAKIKIVSLASIIAKVTRDMYMVRMAKKYKGYGFEQHKGYGTELHYTNLRRLGMTDMHRQTFCKIPKML